MPIRNASRHTPAAEQTELWTDIDCARRGDTAAEPRAFIRPDSGKVNIAPPSREAKWFRLVGVPLGNESELYPAGDEVQTVEPWKPPSTWQDLDAILINRILDDIEAGLENGSQYSAASAAKGDRAAWAVATKYLPAETEQRAREIIKIWLKNGVLYAENYMDPEQRRPREGLRVAVGQLPITRQSPITASSVLGAHTFDKALYLVGR